jgi:DNA (cytosine-5)-methyltransferase 1
LFCGAGGAAVGYERAGFEVVGVDIRPQPRYPFEFHQADALAIEWAGFDVIHASPPCQKYSQLRNLGKQAHMPRFDLIEPVRARIREMLADRDFPYVIENVVGAPLESPVTLCGSTFGLRVRRHRLFESNLAIPQLPCAHTRKSVGVYGDHPQVSVGMNRAHTLAEASEAMGIDWMTWPELCEAIPPAYTEHIGLRLLITTRASNLADV